MCNSTLEGLRIALERVWIEKACPSIARTLNAFKSIYSESVYRKLNAEEKMRKRFQRAIRRIKGKI